MKRLALAPLAGCLLLGLCLSPGSAYGQLSTIQVRDADGAPVEGAEVCVGDQLTPSAYGQGVTDQWGNAAFQVVLPEPPATVYLTARKGGYGATSTLSFNAAVAPPALFTQVTLPDLPQFNPPNCSGESSPPPLLGFQGIEVDPAAELRAGQAFEIWLLLQRPPPGPIPVLLETSHPRLVELPREVTFAKGEQKKRVRVRISRSLTRPETVEVQARFARDRSQAVQAKVRLLPEADPMSRSGRKQ